MTEENGGYNWDEINTDGFEETITEADVDKATATRVPGWFVVLFGEPTIGDKITKDFKNNAGEITSKGYMSFEVGLRMTVVDVLGLDMPVIGSDNKQIKRDGEPATRIRNLTETEKAAALVFYEGMALNSEVRLIPANPGDEKEGTKNRRIKIANAIGILPIGKDMVVKDWRNVEGKKCIVRQYWDIWKDKETKKPIIDDATGLIKKTIKIDFFNGFEAYNENADTQTDPAEEEFEDI